jgi:hypothetical protein
MLRETTSLGVRFHTVERVMCPRRAGTVTTPFGEVGVKIKTVDGEDSVCPEYEECARVARAYNVPIRQVYAAVLAAHPSPAHPSDEGTMQAIPAADTEGRAG